MSDQRSAIAEFRELEQRRLAGGLTTAEVARYDWLRRVLGSSASTGPAAAGFDMGTAAAGLRESLLPAGLRARPSEPAAEPAPLDLDGPDWDELTGQAAPQPAPFPGGDLEAGWLSEEPETAAEPPPPLEVRPQAWNPAAPGYDPEAPYDEAAWIAAGYDPNVVYDWSAYGAQAEEAAPGAPEAAPARSAPAPGEVVTAPAIPLPAVPVSAAPISSVPDAAEVSFEEEDLPTLDVLSADEPGPPAEPAALSEDDGWPGFEPDAAVLPAPEAADEAGLAEPSLVGLAPLDLLAEAGAAAEAPPVAAAAAEPAVFDGLLSDDELRLLASGGVLGEPAPAPDAGPVPAAPAGIPVASPPEAEAVSLDLLEVVAEPEPEPEPEPALPPLPLTGIHIGEVELPELTLEPAEDVDPLHPPLPEAIRGNVFVPPVPVFARPSWPDAVLPLHPPLPEAIQAHVFVPPAPSVAPPPPAAVEPSRPAWPAPAPTAAPEAPQFETAEVDDLFAAAVSSEAPLAPAAEEQPPPLPPIAELPPPLEPAPSEAAPPPLEPLAPPPAAAQPEVAAPLYELVSPPEAVLSEPYLPAAPEPALPPRLLALADLPEEPGLGRSAPTFAPSWPPEPGFAGGRPIAPAPASSPPAWPPPGPAVTQGPALAGFGDYDEPSPVAGRFAAAPPPDPLTSAWDSGGEPELDPAIQPYEPAPPGAPRGEYDDLSGPAARGLESLLSFDPAIASAIPPDAVPEGYESSPAEEARLSVDLELPGHPVPPPQAGPVAELSEVSAEWQPTAALERGFDLASDGSFGLPELSLGEMPAWPPPGPPSPEPIPLAPPGAAPPPLILEDDGVVLIDPDEVIEQLPPPLEPQPVEPAPPAAGPAAPVAASPPAAPVVPSPLAAPPAPPNVFVAPAAGLFSAAARTPAPARSATTPRPSTRFVAPSAELFARPPPASLPPPTPSRTGELALDPEPGPAVPARAAQAAAPAFAARPVELPPGEPAYVEIDPVEVEPAGAAPIEAEPLAATPAAAVRRAAEADEPPAPETTPNVGMPIEAGRAAPPSAEPPPARWSSPAAPVVPRLKATQPLAPPVASPPPAPELDLEPLPPLLPISRFEGTHRVLVHTIDGEVKRGVLHSPVLDADQLTLQPLGAGGPQVLATEAVKAVFFLLGPGEAPPGPEGRKVRVTFRDGRQVAGFSPDYQEGHVGFLLIPVEARTTTARIWVYQASVRQVVVC